MLSIIGDFNADGARYSILRDHKSECDCISGAVSCILCIENEINYLNIEILK